VTIGQTDLTPADSVRGIKQSAGLDKFVAIERQILVFTPDAPALLQDG
jgi:hypothetical protein